MKKKNKAVYDKLDSLKAPINKEQAWDALYNRKGFPRKKNRLRIFFVLAGLLGLTMGLVYLNIGYKFSGFDGFTTSETKPISNKLRSSNLSSESVVGVNGDNDCPEGSPSIDGEKTEQQALRIEEQLRNTNKSYSIESSDTVFVLDRENIAASPTKDVYTPIHSFQEFNKSIAHVEQAKQEVALQEKSKTTLSHGHAPTSESIVELDITPLAEDATANENSHLPGPTDTIAQVSSFPGESSTVLGGNTSMNGSQSGSNKAEVLPQNNASHSWLGGHQRAPDTVQRTDTLGAVSILPFSYKDLTYKRNMAEMNRSPLVNELPSSKGAKLRSIEIGLGVGFSRHSIAFDSIWEEQTFEVEQAKALPSYTVDLRFTQTIKHDYKVSLGLRYISHHRLLKFEQREITYDRQTGGGSANYLQAETVTNYSLFRNHRTFNIESMLHREFSRGKFVVNVGVGLGLNVSTSFRGMGLGADFEEFDLGTMAGYKENLGGYLVYELGVQRQLKDGVYISGSIGGQSRQDLNSRGTHQITAQSIRLGIGKRF